MEGLPFDIKKHNKVKRIGALVQAIGDMMMLPYQASRIKNIQHLKGLLIDYGEYSHSRGVTIEMLNKELRGNGKFEIIDGEIAYREEPT